MRVTRKLEGRDEALMGGGDSNGDGGPAGGRVLSVSEQAAAMIEQATSVDRLAVMFEGWAPWI